MVTVTLISDGYDLTPLRDVLRREAPELHVQMHDGTSAQDAEIAICWKPKHGTLAALPNLKLVHSIAAGVDHILSDSTLPNVPVCRLVDETHARGMTEYICWSLLHLHREFDKVIASQQQRAWQRPPQPETARCRVGFMGLGELGSRAATQVQRLGFAVHGWVKRPRAESDIKVFAGMEALPHFLKTSDILVCLLPLTKDTRGILSRDLFESLPRGAKLVQAGRGEHLVENDLCSALESGRLASAVVDVFDVEPLPSDHVFWRTPNLTVTPHMASVASHEAAGRQIAQNIRRWIRGEKLNNCVDVSSGY